MVIPKHLAKASDIVPARAFLILSIILRLFAFKSNQSDGIAVKQYNATLLANLIETSDCIEYKKQNNVYEHMLENVQELNLTLLSSWL